ncbi:hypothetical protein Agub_g8232 [Astrephomene gubernaculifera]|uniref:Glycosyl transferase CAP10 domain-containing protein n=1 Tax=Astrephomene gubernaculifera TaxID=47775 RepID=A0AAD3HMX2_9CHLO|nr:hypothetical protein Agub_g8232 [Astrephomene gubernaculifera]
MCTLRGQLWALYVLLWAFASSTTAVTLRQVDTAAHPSAEPLLSHGRRIPKPYRNGGRRLHQSQAQQEAAEYCTTGNFTALYGAIERDLQPWRKTGITADLMDWVLRGVSKAPLRDKGVGIVFKGGKPFIITNTAAFETVAHHKRLIIAHLALFAALSATFGPTIPDVEFLVATADEPSSLLHRYGNGSNPLRLPPVLRFCKSNSYADILVPDVHFFMRNFTSRLLSVASNFSNTWPWSAKKQDLFGRFSPYKRAANMHAPELYRRGKGGKDICTVADPNLWFCDVRKHFIWEWARAAKRSGLPVDVAQQPKRDMLHHASHKWLLHLDGQSCSSRLEQLLVLGSCVLKEESGYYAFFHHLIQPYQHYVPFWKERPEEAETAMQWLASHDDQAQRMAAAAQQVATTFLHKRALMCYWLKLLQELASLQRFTPGPEGPEGVQRRYDFWTSVEEYMEGEGGRELARHKLENMEFWD